MAHAHDHSHDHGSGSCTPAPSGGVAGHEGHVHGPYDHHHHHHHEPPSRASLPFAVGVALNLGFVAIEAVYGYLAHSVALIADAAHNLGDVLGLVLAWVAMLLARRRPTLRRTYGWGKSTILAALANAVLILVAVGGVGIEALHRLAEPAPVEGLTVLIVAAVGVVINTVSALLFLRGRERDANLRGAFLHLAADALVSLGVVLAGLTIMLTGWMWIDPAISLIVSLALVHSTWGLLRDALNMAMDAVPRQIDAAEVERFLVAQDEVDEVHDLHIWPMSTTEVALTAHLVIREASDPAAALLPRVCQALRERYAIDHATLQLETPAVAQACALADEDTR